MVGVSRKLCGFPTSAISRRKVDKPGTTQVENTRPLGFFLAEVMKRNISNFRVFGPDETSSNKLEAFTQSPRNSGSKNDFPRTMMAAISSPDGRVIEMLSEHTMEGMLEGYLLTGRHGFLSYLRVLRSRD